jgi:dipeptidyl aminopeptidase/acylaminoacyl peptidase
MKFVALCLSAAFSTQLVALAAPAPELPLEVLFGESQLANVAVSPGGRYLAMLRPHNNRRQVYVVDLEKGASVRLTDMKDENVQGLQWIKDERLTFIMQNKGQESFGVYAVNADGSNLRILRQAGRIDEARRAEQEGGRSIIVDRLPDDPDEVLVAEVRGSSGVSDLYRMNVHTERKRKVENNPGTVKGWITDNDGVARVGIASHETDDKFRILYRSSAKAGWREIAAFDPFGPKWEPLGFDADNRTLFVASDIGRKTKAVFTFDPEEGRFGPAVFADDTYDVVDIIYSRSQRKLLGVRYEAEKPRTVWLEADDKQLQADIDTVLPGTLNTIVSRSRSGRKIVVLASSDRDPGAYHLLDTSTMEMVMIGRVRPDIDPAHMAEMRPIVFTARDGLTLHGYITLPAGVEPRGLPLVVVPHGGPFGPRDSWGFDPEMQYLANRGIAVLQVNFRGSGGYGREFEQAGWGKWGLEMQDDLTDGVRWAVTQGLADPGRLAIYGASYGGYAAMMGVIKDPELYRCAVNYVGVTDLSIILEGFSNLGKTAQTWRARAIGHPLHDKARIAATSPIRLVERIRVPVLMAYGYFDPRVDLSHGNLLEKEMRRLGKSVEYFVEEAEGHGFGKVESRLRFFRAMDRFLRAHLLTAGGDKQNADPEKQATPEKAN